MVIPIKYSAGVWVVYCGCGVEGPPGSDMVGAIKFWNEREERDPYKTAVQNHNDRIGSIKTKSRPKTAEDALLCLADWFDAVYGDVGKNDGVQQDIRGFALDCRRLRAERDELIVAMKDIVAIWEAHEGTAEEDGERMASLAEEMSDKLEI